MPSSRLALRLYAYAFLDELILLYPLYAVLFAETGLSTAQISSLFIIWTATSVLVEVPSGVLADKVSRRLLLVVAPLLAGTAFGLWVVAPSYWAFAVGFVLWGAAGALQSGAFEALAYEELDRLGEARRYAHVIGRTYTASTLAVALAIAAAGPVFALGGYPALGIASVVVCAAAAIVATSLPEHRFSTRRETADPGVPTAHRGSPAMDPSFADFLRSGVAEVRRSRVVQAAVLFLIVATVIWGALDEYLALLAVEIGVATHSVPAVLFVVYVGTAIGGLAGGWASGLSRRGVAVVLAVAAVLLAAGALARHPVGFALIGAAFCSFQMIQIAADARLQHSIAGSARSTVTSLAEFGTAVAMIGVYAIYGLAAHAGVAHAVLFACWAAAYVCLALGLALRHGRRIEVTRAERRLDGMKLWLFLALGILLAASGVIWTLQGLGYIGGSAMSGETMWAVIGPAVALLGLGVVRYALRRRSHAQRADAPN